MSKRALYNAYNDGYNKHRKSDEMPVSNQTFPHLSNSYYLVANRTSSQDIFIRVSKSIWSYFTTNSQSKECFQKKVELKEALRSMFSDIFPYLGVFIVGSSANGCGTNKSDMDICLMVSHEEIEQKNEALLLLRALAKAMRRASFIKNLQVIPAKVPIIKFKDSYNDIDCDINLNNHIGIRNTHLLRVYSDIDWRVSPLILTIKRWADYHDINDASQKTLSSYSFALMAIFYLMARCNPPVVPCLHKLEPEKFNSKTDIKKLRLNDNSILWTSENTQTLGELLMGFLEYYADFDFQKNIISIRTGELIPKDCLPLTDEANNSSYIKIEEPFDLTNTARSVYEHYSFLEIQSVFKTSARVLNSQKNLEAIMAKKYSDFDNRGYDNW